MRRNNVLGPLFLALLLLTACELEGSSTGPTEICESIAEQCRLGGGQLGVCSMNQEGELFCMPQH